jgi:hypothetical protein
MADIRPTSVLLDIASANINWSTDTIKVMLCTAAYTPLVTHTKRSDVTNEVAAGGGYIAGGLTLSTKTATVVGTTVELNSAVANWGSACTITAKWAVFYKSRGGLATADELIQILDLNTASGTAVVSSTNDNFKINPSANGWLVLQ